jgi:GTP cyclohydrolase IA
MEDKIKDILSHIGDNAYREGLRETPARVIKSWKELYSGYDQDPKSVFKTFENEGFDNMVICKDIEFYSMCEHHMLPFFGKAHIGYIPNDKIIGLSKLARLADIFARRLQNQERLTNQIAETLMTNLKPKGVGVILEGKHFCMMSRGVQKQDSSMVTSSLYGIFMDKKSVKEEFLTLIGGK